jgi:flagellar motility protein MotE (MotC chaperone)
MKKSTKSPKNNSIYKEVFIELFKELVSFKQMQWILFVVGAFFIYFMSPDGDPLNKGENGKGSWNLWTGLFFWGVIAVWYFLNKKKPQTLQNLITNDQELKQIDNDIKDLIDSQIPILLRLKKQHPDLWKIAVEKGLVPQDFDDNKKVADTSDELEMSVEFDAEKQKEIAQLKARLAELESKNSGSEGE